MASQEAIPSCAFERSFGCLNHVHVLMSYEPEVKKLKILSDSNSEYHQSNCNANEIEFFIKLV